MGVWAKVFHKSSHRRGGFDGMQAFYVNGLFRALVLSMVGIFTPIFIYRTMEPVLGGYMYGVMAVGVFYLLVRLMVLGLLFPLSKLIERIGFRWSVMVSVVFLGAYNLMLSLASDNWRWFFPAGLLLALNIVFYWIARNSVVILDSEGEEMGKQVGFLTVLESSGGILGPVVGGFLATVYGFGVLYLVAMGILLFSVVPLFYMPHHIHRNGVSLKGYFKWIKSRKFFHQAVVASSRGMDDYGWMLLWPFALSFIFGGLEKLGAVFSFLGFTSVVVRFVSGRAFDKLHEKGGMEDEWMFGVFGVLNALSWVVRMFLSTVGGVFLFEATVGNAGTVFRNLSDDYFYLGGKRMSEIAYTVYREVTYSLAAVFLMLVMILGARLGVWKELVFAMISLWAVLGIVQARESNLH